MVLLKRYMRYIVTFQKGSFCGIKRFNVRGVSLPIFVEHPRHQEVRFLRQVTFVDIHQPTVTGAFVGI